MTDILLSLNGSTLEAWKESLKRCRPFITKVECRIDLLDSIDEQALSDFCTTCKEEGLTWLWTLRDSSEGGSFRGNSEERLSLYQLGDRLCSEYIDIELEIAKQLNWRPTNSKLILSKHNFQSCPESLEEPLLEMVQQGADLLKVAYQAHGSQDLARVLKLYEKDFSKPLIAIAMGEWGECSRLLTAKLGLPWTYACDAQQGETAPGQYSVQELYEVYRLQTISSQSKTFAVIGDPIAHSLSPKLHNSYYAKSEENALYGKIRLDDFESFSTIAQSLQLSGVSVTVPHKESLMQFLEGEHGLKKVGAANTLKKNAESWEVMNTDIEGAISAIEEQLTLKDPKVLMLGAGGVAKALAWGMCEKGWSVTISNRTYSKAQQLAEQLNCQSCEWEERTADSYDLIVNGTTLGMEPHVESTPLEFYGSLEGKLVFDTVYTPAETRLLREAKAAGAVVVSGSEMFYRQAALQHAHWFESEAPFEAMKALLNQKS